MKISNLTCSAPFCRIVLNGYNVVSHCLTCIITLSLTEGENMNLARTGLVEEAMLGKVLLIVFLGGAGRAILRPPARTQY